MLALKMLLLSQKTKKIIFFISLLFGADMLTKWFFFNQNILAPFILPLKNFWISFWIPIALELTIFFTVVICGMIICLYKRGYIWENILILILAWSLWNLFDRIFFWYVRDFVSISSFPVFNFADICITLWAILFLLKTLKE